MWSSPQLLLLGAREKRPEARMAEARMAPDPQAGLQGPGSEPALGKARELPACAWYTSWSTED